MTTYSELVDQIRSYTETDSNVLTTTIINDFIETETTGNRTQGPATIAVR